MAGSDNNYKQVLKGIEAKTGMTIREIQNASPKELRRIFEKNHFKGLDPIKYLDARKILKIYKKMQNNSLDFKDALPKEVIDAQLTVKFFKKY